MISKYTVYYKRETQSNITTSKYPEEVQRTEVEAGNAKTAEKKVIEQQKQFMNRKIHIINTIKIEGE